jgi:ribosomal protein S18 acetylase RimI-like enzyme
VLVVLEPITPHELQAFTAEQIADYAEWLSASGGIGNPAAALAQARGEIQSDVSQGVARGDQFWTARDAQDAAVGWLWVCASPYHALDSEVRFLFQINVRKPLRRLGYGAAMLAELERTLAGNGVRVLELVVWDSNTRARQLYARAGYALVESLESKQRLRKLLAEL